MRILIKFASRSRPDKLFAALDNIFELSKHDAITVLLTLDIDDATCTTNEFKSRLLEYPKVVAMWGTSNSKISAINRDMVFSGEWDILLAHSDDMVFTVPGFDLEILNAFYNFEGLVHFPDQKAGPALITYPMMSRSYFEKDGWVYHPDFISVYADHFQQDIAKRRGMYKYVNKKILEHRHSMWGFGAHDALMLRNENRDNYNNDQITWQRLLKDPKYV